MITREESGLSLADYELLQTAGESPNYRLEMHQWSFRFAADYSRTDPTEERGNDFDAAVVDGHIVWVTHPGLLAVWDGVAWTESTIPDYPSNALGKLSLAVSGTTLYLYVMTPASIELVTTADAGSTWSAWETVRSFTTPANTDTLNLAAAAAGRVFWTIQHAASGATELHYSLAQGGNALNAGDTDLKFVTAPRGMSAVELPDGADLLVMSIDTPGDTSARVIDGKAIKYIMRAGGMIAFRAENGTISDHIAVDVLERMANWRFRECPRLTRVGDKVFLLSATGDGSRAYSFARYRYYTTVDGLHWSMGFILPGITCNGSSGLKLLALEDNVHVMNRRSTWVSPSVLLNDHSTISYDISDRLLAYEAEQSEMHQCALTLSNEDEFFDAAEFKDAQNTWAILVYWGYDQMTELLPVSILEVDLFDYSETIDGEGYHRAVRVVARDHLAWMTDLVQSEQPHYWQAQLVGADNYTDRTTSGYGGMQHTAVQGGMFRTQEDTLLLTSNNEEGVAFSTFKADWNGQIEHGFRLSQPGNNEYAGVCFRGRDKDNLWYAAYFQASDTIKLIQRKGGGESVFAESGALGWTAAVLSTYRFIRARFRYAVIDVDVSTDSVTWTHLFNVVMPGSKVIAGENAPIIDRPLERGFCGVIGKGYSTLDDWEPDIDYFDEGELLDPNEEEEVINEIVYSPDDSKRPNVMLMAYSSGAINRALLHYDTHTTTNDVIAGTAPLGLNILHSINFDPCNPNRVISLHYDGIAVCEDIWAEDPVFTTMQATVDAKPPGGYYGPYLLVTGSRRRKGYFCWAANAWFYYTTDNFETVHRTPVYSHIHSIAIGPYNSSSKGEIWVATGGSEGDIPGLYRSMDWGKTFTRAVFTAVTPDLGQVIPTTWTHVHIPATTQEGLPNKLHKNISGTFVWATGDGYDFEIHTNTYSFNLHQPPFVQRLLEEGDIENNSIDPEYNIHVLGGGKGTIGNASEGRVLNGVVRVPGPFTQHDMEHYWTSHIAFTDKLDGTYHTLLTEYGSTLARGPVAIGGGIQPDNKRHSAWPTQILGYPINPKWMAVVGYVKVFEQFGIDPIGTFPALVITEDGWSTAHEWYSTLPDIGTENEIVSALVDTRDIVTTIEEEWTFEETVTEDDWLNDELGGGDWELGPEYCINFIRCRVNDRGFPQTVEDSFRAYGGFAGIHQYKFHDRYATANGTAGWTPTSGSFNYADGVLTYTPGDTGLEGGVHGTELPHNYLIAGHVTETAGHGFFVNLRSADLTAFTDCHYYVGFDAGRHPHIYKYVPGSGYVLMRIEPMVAPQAGFLEVAVREISFGTDRENLWLSVSVWVDHKLQMTWAEWIKEPPDTGYFFGPGTMDGGPFAIEGLRIPQLTDFVEWNSIDPGETAMSGLQRAIEGRYTKMAMRYDGSLHAWKELPVPIAHTFGYGDMEGSFSNALDRRARITHVRMVGAYMEAEYLRDNLGIHRFEEVKNPYLMSQSECYAEARLHLLRREQEADSVSFPTAYRPHLEIGDRLALPGGDYTVLGFKVNFAHALAMATWQGGKYIGG
jgi:hypothetical protein